MLAVEAKEVEFTYPGQNCPVLKKVDFRVEPGRIVAITGLSGCGKTTLGYCLCGVIPRFIQGDLKGEINLQGRVGIVFQDPDAQLFLPTVEDELVFGPENRCLSYEEIDSLLRRNLELLGINPLQAEHPARLSGGQKQLVALGGVLTLSPDILVLDEALAQLDRSARDQVKKTLVGLKNEGKTIIMMEHDLNNLSIAEEFWSLEQGKLYQKLSLGEGLRSG